MKTNLSIVHDETFWPFTSWVDFSAMPDRDKKVVIIPVVSISDWQMNAPLDFEEVLTMSLLKASLRNIPEAIRFLVIPPMRFNMGRPGKSFFHVDAETAHATLEEVARSIHASGFRKILFLNSSPWNEDLVDSAGRDLRISLGLQPFCINLSSLGLDFLSVSNRPKLLTLREHLLGQSPRPENLPTSSADGTTLMTHATESLCGLLEEVHAFRPLPNDGVIPVKHFSA